MHLTIATIHAGQGKVQEVLNYQDRFLEIRQSGESWNPILPQAAPAKAKGFRLSPE
jgi:hypothetical protein